MTYQNYNCLTCGGTLPEIPVLPTNCGYCGNLYLLEDNQLVNAATHSTRDASLEIFLKTQVIYRSHALNIDLGLAHFRGISPAKIRTSWDNVDTHYIEFMRLNLDDPFCQFLKFGAFYSRIEQDGRMGYYLLPVIDEESPYLSTFQRLRIKWVENLIDPHSRFFEISLMDRGKYHPLWCEMPTRTEKVLKLDDSRLLMEQLDIIFRSGNIEKECQPS